MAISTSGAAAGAAAGTAFGPWGAVAGAVIGGSGLLGDSGQGDMQHAREVADAAYQKLLSVGAPPAIAQNIVLQQYKQAGILTPELQQHIEAAPTRLVSQDNALKQQQQQNLSILQQITNSGLSAQDKASLNQIQQQNASNTQSKLAQIQQNYQQRGQAGGGSELAAALSAAQGGTNNAANQSLQVAGQADQNRINALDKYANQASNMQNQATQVSAQNADIQNQMNRFNTQNQIQQQAANVTAQNQAQATNLSNAQNLANQNVAMNNQETYRSAYTPLQNWQNNKAYAQSQANALLGQATTFAGRGQATADQAGLVGGALGQLGGKLFAGGSDSNNAVSGNTSSGGSNGSYLGNYNLSDLYGTTPTTSNSSQGSGNYLGNSYNFAEGGIVPGKAKIKGNSLKNDTVKAKLSPGEIVLPRSVTQHEDAPTHAADYVAWIKKIQQENADKEEG